MSTLIAWLTFKSFFVGLAPLVWHYGAAGVAVAACLAWAYFSPVFKKTALWVALGIVIGTVCYTTGVKNGASLEKAKWNAANAIAVERGSEARDGAIRDVKRATPDSVRHDPYNRARDK